MATQPTDTDRVLSVLPNPYHALDAFGRPAGVVLKVPDGEGFDGFANDNHAGWIGARIDPKATEVLDNFKPSELRSNRQHTAFEFDAQTPVPVPRSQFYLERLREGSLLPADERTAAAAGIAFVKPAEAQARTREAKRAEWRANYGKDLPGEFDE